MRSNASSGSIIPKIFSLVLAAAIALCVSCSGKKQPASEEKAKVRELAGEWRSDILSGDRVIAAAEYWIVESGDSLELQLLSTKSPNGHELVPAGMWLNAKGVWERNALRLSAMSWVRQGHVRVQTAGGTGRGRQAPPALSRGSLRREEPAIHAQVVPA
ncbi:MAG: hypothetical protein PHD74_08455, partial [Candidatus Krumholzibacteria bacterium]|nr:hypothetical protein [Candidatus Krumholzibacteria bacterium]